jgi:hypothetical protein
MPKKTDEILARIEAFYQAKGGGVIIQRAVRRLRMSNDTVLRHALRAGTSASDVLTAVARALRAPSIRAPGGFRAVDSRSFWSVRRRFQQDSLLRERDPEGISLLVSAFPAANSNGSRTGQAEAVGDESAGWCSDSLKGPTWVSVMLSVTLTVPVKLALSVDEPLSLTLEVSGVPLTC